MDQDRIGRIAEAMAAAWRARAPYETLTGALAPADFDEAYAAQAGVHDRLGPERGGIAGAKIALASKPMQELCHIDHPIAGAIYGAELWESPAEVPRARYRGMGLEFEMAFRLGRDAGLRVDWTAAEAWGLIATVHPAFEIIEDRGADYTRIDARTMVADNAWCGGVVLGPNIPAWRDLKLDDLPSVLEVDGAEAERSTTGPADPLGSFAWLLNLRARQGRPLQAGQVVITGSVIKTRYPEAGQRFRFGFADASVALSVT